jgi:hypothetical protein
MPWQIVPRRDRSQFKPDASRKAKCLCAEREKPARTWRQNPPPLRLKLRLWHDKGKLSQIHTDGGSRKSRQIRDIDKTQAPVDVGPLKRQIHGSINSHLTLCLKLVDCKEGLERFCR